MFVQVIKGHTSDREGLERQLDRWLDELAPGADGWLGATSGTTSDGTFLSIVRFASEEAARRNSERPEQGEWWAETEKYFDGDVTFRDCREVDVMLGGGSNDAGFVQVMEGRVDDPAAMSALRPRMDTVLPRMRPDVLGGLVALHGDGGYTQVVYFTSEDEARKHEAESPEDEEAAALMAEVQAHVVGEIDYYDLKDPRLIGE